MEDSHQDGTGEEVYFDVWDSNVPVEISSYVNDKSITYLNAENLQKPEGKLTHFDLFCGAGGFSVGCEMSGFESVVGIDHFEPAMDTWMKNHPHALGCLGDIRKVNPKAIKLLLSNKGIDKINLLTGGVPCQGFSRSNRKHNDNDARNFLFLEYMKYVDEFQPDYIILENVSGMRETAGGKFEKDIIAAMEELGYAVSVQLLNAADYGVPQIRQRLLFVGVKNDSGLTSPYKFPEGKYREHPGVDLLGNRYMRYHTVGDAISDLPHLNNGELKTVYESQPKNEYQKLMRGDVPDTELNNHEAPNHPEETVKMIQNTEPGQPMYKKFKQRIRLDSRRPSPTQLAGGIRPSFQFGHPTEPRGLSIRERARIQSFPDSYVFMGGIVQERVQTGNAVPPLMIHEITKPIAEDIRRMQSI